MEAHPEMVTLGIAKGSGCMPEVEGRGRGGEKEEKGEIPAA